MKYLFNRLLSRFKKCQHRYQACYVSRQQRVCIDCGKVFSLSDKPLSIRHQR